MEKRHVIDIRDNTHHPEQSELPLICFTVCAPAAVGTSAFSLGLGSGVLPAAFTVVLVTAGMLASIAHLARPLRALRSLAHLGSSWLSREILAVALFWLAAVLWLAAALAAQGAFAAVLGSAAAAPGGAAVWQIAARACNAVAVVLGVLLLWVIARAYRVHGQPAWDGSDTLWELVASAVGSGGTVAAAAASWGVFAGERIAVPLALLGAVALCALVASYAAARFALARREHRVGDLAQSEGTPRAVAAHKALQAKGRPRGYGRCSAIACAFSLVALGCAVLMAAFGGAALLLALALSASACAELAACAMLRSRFYSLAQHVRYVAVRNQRAAAAQRAIQGGRSQRTA